MRATWFGARSGRSRITTLPLVVSMISVFSGSMAGMGLSLSEVRGNQPLRIGGDAHAHHPVLRGRDDAGAALDRA